MERRRGQGTYGLWSEEIKGVEGSWEPGVSSVSVAPRSSPALRWEKKLLTKRARGSATESRGSGDERLSWTGPHDSETKSLVKRA
jgi:hypothetical protein